MITRRGLFKSLFAVAGATVLKPFVPKIFGASRLEKVMPYMVMESTARGRKGWFYNQYMGLDVGKEESQSVYTTYVVGEDNVEYQWATKGTSYIDSEIYKFWKRELEGKKFIHPKGEVFSTINPNDRSVSFWSKCNCCDGHKLTAVIIYENGFWKMQDAVWPKVIRRQWRA